MGKGARGGRPLVRPPMGKRVIPMEDEEGVEAVDVTDMNLAQVLQHKHVTKEGKLGVCFRVCFGWAP